MMAALEESISIINDGEGLFEGRGQRTEDRGKGGGERKEEGGPASVGSSPLPSALCPLPFALCPLPLKPPAPAKIDLAHLPPDDPAVYRMLQTADTVGLFQVESRAQMATLPRLKPANFYDIVVQVAI